MKVLYLLLIPSFALAFTACRTNQLDKADASVLSEHSPVEKASCDENVPGCVPNETPAPCPNCPESPELGPSEGTTVDCRIDDFLVRNRQSFPAVDGCNRCSCRDGAFGCTELGCLDQPRPKGCPVGPFVLPFGKIIAMADGCNSCRCESESKMTCTAHDCTKTDSDLSK